VIVVFEFGIQREEDVEGVGKGVVDRNVEESAYDPAVFL